MKEKDMNICHGKASYLNLITRLIRKTVTFFIFLYSLTVVRILITSLLLLSLIHLPALAAVPANGTYIFSSLGGVDNGFKPDGNGFLLVSQEFKIWNLGELYFDSGASTETNIIIKADNENVGSFTLVNMEFWQFTVNYGAYDSFTITGKKTDDSTVSTSLTGNIPGSTVADAEQATVLGANFNSFTNIKELRFAITNYSCGSPTQIANLTFYSITISDAAAPVTNTAPAFNDPDDTVALTVNEDSGATSILSSLATTDSDTGQTLTWSQGSTAPSKGSLSISGTASTPASGKTPTTATYTPASNANGSDTFTVNVSDGTATDTLTVNVTINAVNDAPSFTKGANQTVNEDAGARTVTGWATSISVGPADESAQTIAFEVTNNTNSALFAAGPAIASNGNLTYTPAANANGSATITLRATEDGGTANGGTDISVTQSFTITVTAVNDEPSVSFGGNQTVNSDAGAQSVSSFATPDMGPTDEDSSQSVIDYIVSNNNNSLFSVQPDISNAGTLTFTPASNANGTATVSVQVQDNGETANSGDDTSQIATFTITVNDNEAPGLTSFARNTPATSPTNEDTLVFRATFDEDVQNVDAADFSVTGTTATITNVNAVSASTYDLTLSGGNLATLNVTVGLDLLGGQNITDLAGNALPAGEPATDETYTVDNDAPGLTSFARNTPATSPTNADTLVFRATFDEDVQNADAADFSVTGTTATVSNVNAVSASTYDLTLSGGNLADLNGTVGLDLAGGQNITDLAGNDLPAGEPATDEIYTMDNTAPTFNAGSSTPADDATEVAVDVSPQLDFSKNIAFGTGNITLYKVTGGSMTIEEFNVATEQGTGNGQVFISGDKLTINPTTDLDSATEYAIQIASTAIDDSAGNSFAGISDNTTYSFTTNIPVPGLWTGTNGTNWNDGGNWDDGNVPTSTVDVDIPDVTNQPTVNITNAECQNLNIQDGATLTIPAGNTLTINGTYTKNSDGKISASGGGKAIIKGDIYKGGTKRIEVASTNGIEIFSSLDLP